MKTHTTRRSLLWGTLLTVAAVTLVQGTGSVRADDTRSLATSLPAAGNGALPYFWTENNDAQIHSFMLQAQQMLFNPQRTASQAFCIAQSIAPALAARALD